GSCTARTPTSTCGKSTTTTTRPHCSCASTGTRARRWSRPSGRAAGNAAESALLVLVAPDPPESALELRGDDPHLVRLALRDLRQRLDVLVGEQLRIRVPLVDGLEDRADRLGLALGREDRRLLLPLRLEDGGALLAIGAHLLLHRVLDRRRRVDRLQLDPVDADPPLSGRLVEHAAQRVVDLVARRERLLEREPADHVPQR